MFYENERIVRKQMKVVNSKAYEIIHDLEAKGLDNKEIIACVKLLLAKEDNSEFQVDILKQALKTVNSKQESSHAAQIDTSFSFIDGRVQPKCAGLSIGVEPKKRKALRNSSNT